MVHTTVTVQYSTVLSGNIWQELELEPKLEPKLWTKVEPEPKINNFGSATLQQGKEAEKSSIPQPAQSQRCP